MSEMTLPAEKTPDQIASMEAAMAADGVPTHQRVQQDYFGFEEIHRCIFPDGVTYVEHKTLTEGDRRKYLNKVNREVKVQRATGDAIMNMKAGEEKIALLEAAVVGWNFIRGGEPVAFNKATFQMWLENADPRLVDLIEKDIRRHNAWLQGEMTLEDIQRERESLNELEQQILREQEGKVS